MTNPDPTFADPTPHPRNAHLLKLLADNHDEFAPPPRLAERTIGRLAQILVAEGRYDSANNCFRAEPVAVPSDVRRPQPVSDGPVYFGWPRADVVVMAALVLLVVSLGLPLIQKVRRQADLMACQDQLRTLSASLHGYADTHGGKLPQVGTPQLPTAGGFVATLIQSGHASPTRTFGCGRPEGDPEPGYAYTLGHLNTFGQPTGLRLAEVPDQTPIAADLPRYDGATVTGRHGGWNVLAAGGHVRRTTTVHAGWEGDDIFRNNHGWHRAGLNLQDTSLGRPFDQP